MATIDRAMEWHGMKRPRRRRGAFRWRNFLWWLVYPQAGRSLAPTVSGIVLIGLSVGVGIAAYNSANNILFITLSLLLACLIFSGVLSWLNFRGLGWRLQVAPPLRAGQETLIAVGLRNEKRLLPTYGVWFDLAASARRVATVIAGERFTRPKDRPIREVLAAAEKARTRMRLFLRGRLDPGAETRLEWAFRPARRGVQALILDGIGSRFPFGFLNKRVGTTLRREVVVWPAPIEYRRYGALSTRPQSAGEQISRAGYEGDLLALRKYQPGDSHRLIHWKASARTRQLLVRQFSAERQEAFAIWLQTAADVWTRPEQFELFLSFAGSLAEDLFRAGKLTSVTIDTEPPRPVRRVRDLESFLDRLATIEPRLSGIAADDASVVSDTPGEVRGRRNVLTFSPDGSRGVAAFVDGQRAAAT